MSEQPHEDCPLCYQLVATRQWRITELQKTVTLLEEEVAEINQGMRHNAFHEAQRWDRTEG